MHFNTDGNPPIGCQVLRNRARSQSVSMTLDALLIAFGLVRILRVDWYFFDDSRRLRRCCESELQ